MAKFKKLSDVEVVAEPAESANVLIEEDGIIKKAPKAAVGGGVGGGIMVNFTVNRDFALTKYDPFDFQEIKEAVLSGAYVAVMGKTAVGSNMIRTVSSLNDATISFDFSGYMLTLFSDNTASFEEVSDLG